MHLQALVHACSLSCRHACCDCHLANLQLVKLYAALPYCDAGTTAKQTDASLLADSGLLWLSDWPGFKHGLKSYCKTELMSTASKRFALVAPYMPAELEPKGGEDDTLATCVSSDSRLWQRALRCVLSIMHFCLGHSRPCFLLFTATAWPGGADHLLLRLRTYLQLQLLSTPSPVSCVRAASRPCK
jgi:hypothetical protein